MSVTRTFTVTVVSTGSGNKYVIDGVQQATILLGEGGTYKFDQSDSSNSTHPLRFATAEDASGGSQYTTGVTSSGSPGDSGAYTQITVAASAPDLYYYCTNHGGMGGQANTVDGNSWGIFPWGVNEYGDQDSVDITLTGLSTTSSVGAVEAFPQQGWGRQQWGNSGWGIEYSVELTGQSATTSLGSITTEIAVPLTGLSTTSSVGSTTFVGLTFADLTGVQATTELGDFDNAGTLVGWGRNGWGEEPYGDSFNRLEQPAGVSVTTSVGSLTALPEELISVTGVSATSAVGSLTTIIDCVVVPTGVSVTSNLGTPLITQATVGLTGVSATSTVGGIILDAVEIGIVGVEVTSAVGLLQEQIAQIPTGQQATSSVGSLTVGIGVSLTGVSATTAVGTIIPAENALGLTGVEAISSVGNISPLGYGDVDITGNTSYNNVDVTHETTYTDVTHVA
jgi:hypothetical protein